MFHNLRSPFKRRLLDENAVVLRDMARMTSHNGAVLLNYIDALHRVYHIQRVTCLNFGFQTPKMARIVSDVCALYKTNGNASLIVCFSLTKNARLACTHIDDSLTWHNFRILKTL